MFDLKPISTNDLIIAISGLIVLVYTIVTYLLWRQSLKQTEINLMPIPVIYARNIPKEVKKNFRIRNLGYGPMLNVKIDKFSLIVKDSKDKWTVKLKVPVPNVLKCGEERDLIVTTYLNRVIKENFDMSPHLDPEFAKFSIPLDITFENIEGVKYTTTIGMGKGELSVVKPVRKIRNSIIRKVKKWIRKKEIWKTF